MVNVVRVKCGIPENAPDPVLFIFTLRAPLYLSGVHLWSDCCLATSCFFYITFVYLRALAVSSDLTA